MWDIYETIFRLLDNIELVLVDAVALVEG